MECRNKHTAEAKCVKERKSVEGEDAEFGVGITEENAQKERRKVTAARLHAKVKHNGFRCDLSGVELSPEQASLDHIVPLSRGGHHEIDNVAIIHRVINRMKGTMTEEEFVSWCTKVADWNRQKANKKRLEHRESMNKTLQKRCLFE